MIETESIINQPKRLKERLSQIPQEPGCYLMIDNNHRVLYIGKSKNIKNRVTSYFRGNSNLSPRINLMVRQINEIEFIVTDNETEALTLESNLIKQKQPYFNVLLKDDKKYPYLCITWSEEYPRMFITRRRRARKEKDRYYGPFVDVGLLRKTLFLVKRVFPLRQRPKPLFKDRTCLNYSIGRCPGVCQEKITSFEYHKTIKRVSMIFQGRTDDLSDLLKEQMVKYADQQQYELAASVRDQIKGLNQLQEEQKMTLPDSSISRDVVAMARDEKLASIQIFQMRSGKLVGRLGYIADANKFSDSLILKRIIEEHYSLVEPVEIPNQILLQYEIDNQNIIENWLSDNKGRKVRLLCPKIRDKADFITLVKRNASYELDRIRDGSEKVKVELEDLASFLELEFYPRRIEGYDISHIQGSDAVASQVVFIDGVPARQHYRKYKIKNKSIRVGHSDDFLSLAEVIERRFMKWSRFKQQGGDIYTAINNYSKEMDQLALNDWPDLIMIDGGKGQLSAVKDVLIRLDLDRDVMACSLAKRNEDVFIIGQRDKLKTEFDQPGLLLLRRLRDEAHRFALSFHRQQRGSKMTRSCLSEIPGMGPKRIKELLNTFHSVEAIQLASVDQLANTPGLGKDIAFQVWNYFHNKDNSIS